MPDGQVLLWTRDVRHSPWSPPFGGVLLFFPPHLLSFAGNVGAGLPLISNGQSTLLSQWASLKTEFISGLSYPPSRFTASVLIFLPREVTPYHDAPFPFAACSRV